MTTSPTLRASASPREITQWPVKLLGEICEVIGGGTPSKDKSAYYRGDIPWATVRDMRQDIISDTEFRITEEAVRDSATNIIPSGNVVIATRVGLGKVCLLGQDTAINQDLRGFIPRDAKTLKVLYLYWWLKSVSDVIIAEGTGATVQGVKLPFIKSLPLSLPPLPEQVRIVAILDEAFDGIAKAKATAEANLQNARALFQSHLQTVFNQKGEGWVEKTLEEISTDFGRGKSKHRPRNAPHLYGGKYPFVQTGDIRNAEHFITEYSQSYSEAGLSQSKLWPKGTICITIAANIAETAILGFDACFPDSVIGVVANPKEAEVGYIEYVLQSFKSRIQAMGKGSAQANINMGTFENERFPFPPVQEQKRIVEQLDDLAAETQRLESLYQNKLNSLDELKKSLLHQAFTGNL
jgi:type I restriction enzyme S subunit